MTDAQREAFEAIAGVNAHNMKLWISWFGQAIVVIGVILIIVFLMYQNQDDNQDVSPKTLMLCLCISFMMMIAYMALFNI